MRRDWALGYRQVHSQAEFDVCVSVQNAELIAPNETNICGKHLALNHNTKLGLD